MSDLAARLLLHVLTDRAAAGGRSDEDIVTAALAGGATVIQLRGKQSSGAELVQTGRRLRVLTRQAGALLIVNDRVDVALAVDADGAHVGQDDLPAADARRLLGPDRLLGVSAADVEQALRASAAGADYIGFGPVFATASKDEATAPTGLAVLRAVCRATATPVVAIGGMSSAHAAAVMEAGAIGIAAIAAVVGAPDVTAATRELCLALRLPAGT